MRHPWRFYPASAGQFTAASKGVGKSKSFAYGENSQPSAKIQLDIRPRSKSQPACHTLDLNPWQQILC